MEAYRSTRLGVWIFRLERLQLYYQKSNSFILLYLLMDKTGWSWWYLLVIPFAVAAHYFDKHIKLPAEMDAQGRSNPIFMEQYRLLQEIHAKVVR